MSGKTNIDVWLAQLYDCKCLSERDLRIACELMKELLIEESNVQPVAAPVTIVGDIHGQFHDLVELFNKGGMIPKTRYIFMGDYVDRGYNSVETFQLLMCLKLKYPAHITLLRGNHETRQITSVYGYYDENMRKYGNANAWKYCMEVFDNLGLGAVVEGKIFCVHGGLSPDIKTLDQIRLFERRMEPPHDGPFCDLMWSDPTDSTDNWQMSMRGAGWLFGGNVTNVFNHINGLNLVARAHQLVNDGFQYWFKESSLVTVWSAPNYCYRCGNVASILNISENLERNFEIFYAVEGQTTKAKDFKKDVPYFL